MQLVQPTLDDLTRALFRLGRDRRVPGEEGAGQYDYAGGIRRIQ